MGFARLAACTATAIVLIISSRAGAQDAAQVEITCDEDIEVIATLGSVVTVENTDTPIAIAAGGTPPYEFDVDPGIAINITGSPFTSVQFPYTVTDANGTTASCQTTLSIIAVDTGDDGQSDDDGVVPPVSFLSIACNEDTEKAVPRGVVTTVEDLNVPIAIAAWGTPPYAFNINPMNAISLTGEPTISLAYTYIVTDAVGSTASCATTLSIVPSGPALSITCNPPTEESVPAGVVTTVTDNGPVATAAGGTPPYTYSVNPLNPISLTGAPSLHQAFPYTVTDADGSTASCMTHLFISESGPALSIACNDDTEGFAPTGEVTTIEDEDVPIATAAGGTPPYMYSVDPFDPISFTDSPFALKEFPYTVEDQDGTTASCTKFMWIFTSGPALSLTCNPDTEEAVPAGVETTVEDEGIPIATPEGGTPPYTFSVDPLDPISLTDVPTTQEAFPYTVTDAAGATASCTTNLLITESGPGLSIECNADTEKFVPDGVVTTVEDEGIPIAAAAGGTPPYTFSVDPLDPISLTDSPFAVQEFPYTVEDQDGTTASCSTYLWIFSSGPALSITCNPDTVKAVPAGVVTTVEDEGIPIATAAGGTPPYVFSIDPLNVISLTGAPTIQEGFTYTVTDADGTTASCTTTLFIIEEGDVFTPPPTTTPPTPTPTYPYWTAPPMPTPDPYWTAPPTPTPVTPYTPTTAPPAPTPVTPFTPTTAPPTPTPVTPYPGSPPSTPPPTECSPGTSMCDDPHMRGLHGQRIDWSGVNGGWYSVIKDDSAGLHINVRLTAPLPEEFPNRQLITGLSILSEGYSLVVEVKNPYTVGTDGCPRGILPCLANGGIRIIADGKEVNDLLRFSREVPVADGIITMSASNLPAECQQFGGDKIWARVYEEMMQERRGLAAYSFEDWILSFHSMAAPEWCVKYIEESDLADLQSSHAIFKIDTPTATVRLNVGVNYQGDGELDWDGRVLPDLEFWQMDVGFDGLDIENPALSGMLGETAHPVYDAAGREIMEGFEAFRGDVEDYRVIDALGTHFALLDDKEGARR